MADVFPTPSFRVPGLLDDEALAARMKLYADQQNREAGAGPTPAAVEFADKIKTEFLDQPTRRAAKGAEKLAPDPQPSGFRDRMRSDVESATSSFVAGVGQYIPLGLLGGALAEGGPLAKLGTLSPEEQEAETIRRYDDAKEQEAATKRHIETREALRSLTDDDATQLGIPVQPGGTDSQTIAEARQREAGILKSVEERTAERRAAVVTGQNMVEQSQWLSMSREALRGLERVPVQTMKLAPILWEAASGFDEKSDMRGWLDAVNRNFDAMLPPDKARAKDFMTEVASGTGSMVGFLTLTAMAGVAGIPSKAATFMIGAAQGASSQFEDAEQHKAAAWQKYAALLAGAGVGATEAIPIDRMLLRAEQATGGLVSRMLANTAASSLEEFIQEFGQSIGEDVVAKWTYDENRKVDVVAALRSGAAGAISGGLSASATSTLAEAGFGPKAERDRLAEQQAQEASDEQAAARAAQEIEAREAQIDDFIAANQAQVEAIVAKAAADLELVEPVQQDLAAMLAPVEAGQEQDLTPLVETIKAKGLQPITTTTSEFVAALPRPQLFEVSGEVGAGGALPRLTAEGNITLRHYAPEVRETLDPEKMGTGDLRGAERERLFGDRAVPRTYYGVGGGPEFQEPAVSREEFTTPTKAELAAAKKLGIDRNRLVSELGRRYGEEIKARGYTPEQASWNVVHEVDIGRDELYNLRQDPLKLKERIPERATGTERITEMKALVRDEGFKGYYVDRSDLGQTAVLFDARTPDRVLDRATNLPLDQVARPAEFDAPTPETFQKAGWAVVTGTQEADGAFDTPKNLRANTKLRKELRERGVDFREIEGTYRGVPQGTSFLIFTDEATAAELGAKYKQESILTKDGLVYTDGSERVTPARGVVLGDEARAADFQSTLPNGEAFSVDLDFDATAARTPDTVQRAGASLPYDPNIVTVEPSTVQLEPAELEALPGLTTGKPVESVVRAARAYAEARGLPVRRQTEYVKVDVERAKRIAEAYEAMKDDPTDPAVAAAYDAMIEETLAQYQFVKATGLQIEAIEPGQADPYPEGPKQVLEDLARGHLWFFPTDQGFGSLTEAQQANPLLRPTDEYLNGRQLLANDVFRIVHDFFGHGIEGSGFGARGEENAWQSHMRLYSDAALPAVTSETRGQNSWVNYGPHGESNRSNQRETIYADQKAGIMPDWTWKEGVAEDRQDLFGAQAPAETPAFQRWFGDSKVVDENGDPLVVYHGTNAEFKDFAGIVWVTPDRALAEDYGTVRELYAKVERPFNADLGLSSKATFGELVNAAVEQATEQGRTPSEQTLEAVKAALDVAPAGEQLKFKFWDTAQAAEQTKKVLEQLGFDGIAYREKPGGGTGGVQTFAAFRPDQVRNATSDMFGAQQGKGGTTSSTRNAFKAEPKRKAGGIAQTGPAGAGESLAGLSQSFIKLMDLTARQGRLTLKGGAVGQYSAKQDTVRLKTWNDFSTLVHEGGHALHMSNPGPELAAWIKANEAELMVVARKLYGGDLSKMQVPEKIAEGFAEFFRVYVTNRAYAKKNNPTLTQTFDDLLMKTAPELKAGLDAVGAGFQAWLQKPSTALLRDMVVSGAEPGAINRNLAEISEGGFGNWFSGVARSVIGGLVDRNAQLNRLVADVLNKAEDNAGRPLDLKRAEDPRVLIRLATNAGNRAIVQTTDGVMAYQSTDPSTRGLQEALLRYHGVGPDGALSAIDPVRKQDFAAYLIALRGIDEYRRFADGKIERPPLAATLGDLRQAVKDFDAQYGADFRQAAQIVHEYGMGLWQKSYDAGLISKETYNEGLDRQFYAPLQRDLSDRDITTGDFSAAAARQGRSIVKRFKGSDRDIIDPMDILMQKTFALERTIAENDVKKALAALADRAGKAGALVERVPAHRLLGSEYSVQEVARQLTKDSTMTAQDAQDLMEMLEPAIEEGNRIALFRSQQAVARGENILFFWEQGKLAAIQLKDGDIGADIINTMNGIGRENMPVWLDTIAMTSSLFRGAVTKWPDFLLVNFIRDQASAFILTDVGYKPFVTGIKGVGDEIRQTGWARQYNAAMGVMGGMNSEALHRARVDRDISALRAKGYLARVFDGTWAGRLRGFARVTELTETGTRLGIFRAAFERAKADGLTDWEASIEGSYLATDYIDFSLSGNQMLIARRLVPFLNAQLQGLYKLGRTLGASEIAQRKGLNFAIRAYFKDINGLDLSRTEKQALQTGRKAWAKMASLALLGAALALAYRDNEDYQDASEYLRATGWVIPLGEGRIFYIPKPFELAVFSNFAERAIEYGSGDDAAPMRFLRGLAMNLSPPTTPPALGVAVEEAMNYNVFTESDIVPDYMRALAPELQYNARTSEFAKQLGAMLDWSPLRIDHVMSGLGASAYRDLSSMYNSVATGDRPSSDVTDWPVTRRFVRDARRGSASSQDFWKYASTADGTLRRAELSYRNYLDAGQEQAANEYLNGLEPDERAYALLNAHFKADAKRLNPFYRARQINTVISAMRRELYSAAGVDDTTTKISEPMKISAQTKSEIDKALSELARREMRNTLIYAKDPGWANKSPLPTDTTVNLLLQIHPGVQAELMRRLRKAKVYSAETVQNYWPEARNRLLSDREQAFLGDLISVAKATAQ